MSTGNSENLEALWQQRLLNLKEASGMSYQVLAVRLKMDPSNLYKACQGKLKLPLPARIRFFDFYGFRSLRSAVLSVLPDETARMVMKRHDSLITNTMQKQLKMLPQNALEALAKGDEHSAWMAILDDLKLTYKTDQKLAEALGSSRSMLSMVRSTGQRLPIELKLRALDMTDFIVTDELLLSLLPTLAIDAIKEDVDKRPSPQNEAPLDPRLMT